MTANYKVTDKNVCSTYSFKKLARDDELLNLGSPFVNSQRANVSVKSFNHAAAHESLSRRESAPHCR